MDNIHFITAADTYPCYNYKYKLAAVSTKYKLVKRYVFAFSWVNKTVFTSSLGQASDFT